MPRRPLWRPTRVLRRPAGEPFARVGEEERHLLLAEGVEDALDQHHLRAAELTALARPVDPGPEEIDVLPVPVDDRDALEARSRQLADHVGDDRDQRLGPLGEPADAGEQGLGSVAWLVVRDPRWKKDGVIHSDAKIEFFFRENKLFTKKVIV